MKGMRRESAAQKRNVLREKSSVGKVQSVGVGGQAGRAGSCVFSPNGKNLDDRVATGKSRLCACQIAPRVSTFPFLLLDYILLLHTFIQYMTAQ
jgi:hypothetical protein